MVRRCPLTGKAWSSLLVISFGYRCLGTVVGVWAPCLGAWKGQDGISGYREVAEELWRKLWVQTQACGSWVPHQCSESITEEGTLSNQVRRWFL